MGIPHDSYSINSIALWLDERDVLFNRHLHIEQWALILIHSIKSRAGVNMDGEKSVLANETVDNEKPSKAQIESEIKDYNKSEPHEAPMKKNAKTRVF